MVPSGKVRLEASRSLLAFLIFGGQRDNTPEPIENGTDNDDSSRTEAAFLSNLLANAKALIKHGAVASLCAAAGLVCRRVDALPRWEVVDAETRDAFSRLCAELTAHLNALYVLLEASRTLGIPIPDVIGEF